MPATWSCFGRPARRRRSAREAAARRGRAPAPARAGAARARAAGAASPTGAECAPAHPRHILPADLQLLYFEDLPLGAEWTTRRRTVTETDLVTFSGLVGDFNPLHVDQEYARNTQYGGLVLPSSLIAGLAIGLGSMDVPVPVTVAMVGMTWRYLQPLRVGDTIQARWRLTRKRSVENPKWGLAVWWVEVSDQDGHVAAEGEIMRLVARAEPEQKAPPSRRRRRRRSAAPDTTVLAAEPVPEPAPADAPSPAARRRRRRRPASSGGEPAEAPSAEPLSQEAEAAPAAEPAPSSPRRRRRRRPSNGSRTAPSPLETGPVTVAPEPPAAPPADSVPRDSGQPTPSGGSPAITFSPVNEPAPEPGGRVGRVIRRLRGRRDEDAG